MLKFVIMLFAASVVFVLAFTARTDTDSAAAQANNSGLVVAQSQCPNGKCS